MRPDAVIFDLDGTLVDTLDDIADAMDHVLGERGLPPVPRDRYRVYIGEGVRQLAARAVPSEHHDCLDHITAAFRAYYGDHLMVRSRLYDGIGALLDRLAAAGLPLAILSNKPDPMTRRLAASMLGRWPFRAVAGHRSDVPRKPHPAAAVAIAETLGTTVNRCAFVGDTRTDMETAVSAGMIPIGVSWGFRDRAELEAHGARAVAETPAALLDLLL